MQKLLKERVSSRSNTAVIIGFIVSFIFFFSLNLVSIPRIFGYGGDPTPIPTTSPPPAPTMKPTVRPTTRPITNPVYTVVPTETPLPTIMPDLPHSGVELFDIILTVDNPVVTKSTNLIARTQFTSFGNVPTLVKLVYRIENSSGKIVYTENAEITVETVWLVTKEFKDLNLDNGKYTLFVNTTYGDNVQDEFKQTFEVKGVSTSKGDSTSVFWIVSIITVVLVGGFFIYRSVKHNQHTK